jgi:hypothetical protein
MTSEQRAVKVRELRLMLTKDRPDPEAERRFFESAYAEDKTFRNAFSNAGIRSYEDYCAYFPRKQRLLQSELDQLSEPPEVTESEERYTADPDAWMAAARAKLDQVEKELRSSSRSMNGEGTSDLQSVGVRSL